jgi:hypothetical protein
LGALSAVKTYTNASPELGIAKITFPLVTNGNDPLFRLPDPSELMVMVPELGGAETEPVVVCVDEY